MFDLPGDFRFTQHHGIHAAGDGKKVAHRLGALLDIEIWREIKITARREVLEDVVNVAIHFRCHSVNLHAVAGGQEDHFRKIRANFEPAPMAMQTRRVHRKFFAQFHRRGFVAETCDKDAHENAFSVRPILASLESVAASESLRWLLLITRSL